MRKMLVKMNKWHKIVGISLTSLAGILAVGIIAGQVLLRGATIIPDLWIDQIELKEIQEDILKEMCLYSLYPLAVQMVFNLLLFWALDSCHSDVDNRVTIYSILQVVSNIACIGIGIALILQTARSIALEYLMFNSALNILEFVGWWSIIATLLGYIQTWGIFTHSMRPSHLEHLCVFGRRILNTRRGK